MLLLQFLQIHTRKAARYTGTPQHLEANMQVNMCKLQCIFLIIVDNSDSRVAIAVLLVLRLNIRTHWKLRQNQYSSQCPLSVSKVVSGRAVWRKWSLRQLWLGRARRWRICVRAMRACRKSGAYSSANRFTKPRRNLTPVYINLFR